MQRTSDVCFFEKDYVQEDIRGKPKIGDFFRGVRISKMNLSGEGLGVFWIRKLQKEVAIAFDAIGGQELKLEVKQ